MRYLVLLLLAAAAPAGEPRVDLPFDQLSLREGAQLVEGTRMLGDAFPYLRGLRPAKASRLVGPVRTPAEAIAAARLFVAGPLVTTEAQAERVVAEARKLRAEFTHLKPKIGAFRPESYAPRATRDGDGFAVSLVAFEMDRNLQLVHVTAKVWRDGTVKIARRHVVDGPMTSWQTAVMARDEGDAAAIDRAMREEATLARRRYARALRPRRDLGTAWAIARLAPSIAEVEDLWGEPDHVMGSGLLMHGYDLPDGTSILFAAPGRGKPCAYIRHIKRPPASGALHTLYSSAR